MTTIFFLGVGHMGGGMAANLAKAGFEVLAYDINDDNLARAVANGCTAAESTAAGAAAADVVMTSLPGPMQISSAGQTDDGLLPNMRPGTTWIDLSTNDLDTARMLAEAAAERGITLIDAPVSGGPEGAAAGTLSVYVGGPQQAVIDLMPVFEAIGANVDHLGPHGAGYVAKIAQVTLCYTQTITFVEALMLGVKGGVAPAKMTELIQKSAGRSYVADVYGPEIVAGMRELAESLVARGAEVIVAGCTEIPLVLDAGMLDVPLVSSTDALARATVAMALSA